MINQDLWPATRDAALQRIEEFIPHAGGAYAKRRNFDFGQNEHLWVSRLSPWLRHRAVTEFEVIQATLERHSEKDAQKFIQETIWRTYWKGWLQHRPALWAHYLQSLERQRAALQTDTRKLAVYESAISAQTHIELFNSWTTELLETGYLHNHARMWYSSIWVFTLKLPWQLGADFFIRHLLDGDPASNTLSWRWVAGLHTNGKAYLATAENIRSFAPERAEACPRGLDTLAEEAQIPAPTSVWPVEAHSIDWSSAGLCAVDSGSADCGLLLHEDDCGHAFSELAEFVGPTAALAVQPCSDEPLTAKVASFRKGVLAESVEGRLGNDLASTLKSPREIVEWAESTNLRKIYTPFAPAGPVAVALDRLKSDLKRSDVALHRLVRPYDKAVWPHASKGFFKLNKQIPKILSVLAGA